MEFRHLEFLDEIYYVILDRSQPLFYFVPRESQADSPNVTWQTELLGEE